ncbi:MAG: integration host factor subunit alpha [Alphaproteobacteria bacterium]|nr:integration host factor subunit alpha [Alphaproteobacteria bacterium]
MTTVTRADIAQNVCEEIGLSRKDAGDILDMVIDEMKNELIAGRDVKISTFGSFLLKRKNARIGRNPKTGVEAEITPRTVISFRPSQTLKTAVNKGAKKAAK